MQSLRRDRPARRCDTRFAPFVSVLTFASLRLWVRFFFVLFFVLGCGKETHNYRIRKS
jgi:hypothetical protein